MATGNTGSQTEAAAARHARLDGLPVEVLAHITLYLGHEDEDPGYVYLDDLYALRCACRACEPAVRLSAKDHALLSRMSFRPGAKNGPSSVRHIATWGRVFGSGCRELDIYTGGDDDGRPRLPPAESLNALRTFVVVNTLGRLRELELTLPWTRCRQFSLELCRACPQLKVFVAKWTAVDGVTSADIDSFAAELSSTCPLLENVEIRKGHLDTFDDLSPAETYQMHFPATKILNFQLRASRRPAPTLYAAIEATARACVCADELDFSECPIVLPRLLDVLLRTPLRGRVRKIDLSFDTDISAASILRFARECEALVELILPDHPPGTPSFYRSLAQARPTLKNLDLGYNCSVVDNACLRMICELLSLERLRFVRLDNLTSQALDIILDSPTAQTLRAFDDYETPIFNSATMLLLVSGCPLLSKLEWSPPKSLSPIEDGANVDAINELLKSRGGEEFDSQYGLSAYMPFGPSIYCPERGRMVRPPEERSVSAEESGEASEVDSDESDDDAPGSEDSDDSSSVPEFLYAFRW